MTDNRISVTLTFASDTDPAVVATRVAEVVVAGVAVTMVGVNWHGFSTAETETTTDEPKAD